MYSTGGYKFGLIVDLVSGRLDSAHRCASGQTQFSLFTTPQTSEGAVDVHVVLI